MGTKIKVVMLDLRETYIIDWSGKNTSRWLKDRGIIIARWGEPMPNEELTLHGQILSQLNSEVRIRSFMGRCGVTPNEILWVSNSKEAAQNPPIAGSHFYFLKDNTLRFHDLANIINRIEYVGK